MVTDPKIMEAWFTLMAEAMKGTSGAQEAFRSLSKNPLNPADLTRWFSNFMPGSTSSTTHLKPEMLQEWVEEWWRTMGVVPRSRYVELLEKNDELSRRIEQAQETIRKMRAALDSKGQQKEYAGHVLDLWKSMLDETLKTQTEWAKAWKSASAEKENSTEGPSEDKPKKH
jgi:hypothetical protein